MRANPLAQKILASDIALGLNDSFSFYTPDNCAYSSILITRGDVD